jgi:tetratricopeptide (TPR) repeat protein
LAESHRLLGSLLEILEGHSGEAAAAYRAALKEHQRVAGEHPNVPGFRFWVARCHHQLGTSLAYQGKQADAEAEYRAAVKEQQPLEEQRDFREFRDLLASTHFYGMGMVTHHCTLGDALRQKGDGDGAIREYQAAIRLKPDDPWRHYSLGNFLRDLGRYNEAEAAFREATRIKLDDPTPHYMLGVFLLSALGQGPDGTGGHARDARRGPSHARRPERACRWRVGERPGLPH